MFSELIALSMLSGAHANRFKAERLFALEVLYVKIPGLSGNRY